MRAAKCRMGAAQRNPSFLDRDPGRRWVSPRRPEVKCRMGAAQRNPSFFDRGLGRGWVSPRRPEGLWEAAQAAIGPPCGPREKNAWATSCPPYADSAWAAAAARSRSRRLSAGGGIEGTVRAWIVSSMIQDPNPLGAAGLRLGAPRSDPIPWRCPCLRAAIDPARDTAKTA